MANAMVIGIGGVGSVMPQKLHEFECYDRIVLADIDPVFAHQLAARTPRSRFAFVQANALDIEALTSQMRDDRVAVTFNAKGIPPVMAAKLLVTRKMPERGVMMSEGLAPKELMNSFTREGFPIFAKKREVERF